MQLGPEVGDGSKFLTRYKRLVDVEAIGDIAIPSRSESRDGAHETRTISSWTEFALVSKLLVEQIMSLRLSDREKGKKLLEESEKTPTDTGARRDATKANRGRGTAGNIRRSGAAAEEWCITAKEAENCRKIN